MSSDAEIEVELKFRVPDPTAVRRAVQALGGTQTDTIDQADTYYAHPVRDFARTDEALRVRLVDETGCVTYKGPLLDAVTKSREETEVWFAGGTDDARRFGNVLGKLGFTAVRTVKKRRERWTLGWEGRAVEIAFDCVEGLGEFVELETAASKPSFESAKASLLALAGRLELATSERRSYLALLICLSHG